MKSKPCCFIRRNALVLAVAAALPAATVQAGTLGCDPWLYGAAFDGKDDPAVFYSIDPSTGQATSIGTTIGVEGEYERVSAMDIDPISGKFYAFAEFDRPTLDDLHVFIEIDPATGIGNASSGNSIDFSSLNPGDNHIAGMSYNSAGVLYGFGNGGEGGPYGLYTLDPILGTATLIGTSSPSGDGSGNGIAFDNTSPTNILYHSESNNLNTVNTSDGSTTLAFSHTWPVSWGSPKISSMDYGPDNDTWYAIVKDADDDNHYLATVDVSDGTVTSIGLTADNLDALTYQCRPRSEEIFKDGFETP